MDWIQSAIRDFSHCIGIADLQTHPEGLLQLEIGGHTRCAIEPAPEGEPYEVLVSMSRALERDVAAIAIRALRRAFFPPSPGLFVQVAVADLGGETRLIAVTRLPARSCTVQALLHAVSALHQWIDVTQSPGDGDA